MGWLDGISGAADGLQGALTARLMRQRQAEQDALQRQKFAEEQRQNAAQEDFRNRQLQQQGELMRQTQAEKEAAQATTAANAVRDDTRAAVQETPIGASVLPSFRSIAVKSGAAPSALFQEQQTPATPGSPDTYAKPSQAAMAAGVPESLAPNDITYTGTQSQRLAKQAADDAKQGRVDALASRDENAQANRDLRKGQNDILNGFRQQGLDAKAEKADEIKLGEGGKRALRSINGANALIPEVEALLKNQYPGIETNPNSYNGLRDKAGALVDYGKYWSGFADENSPRIQLLKLLQPVQAGQYLAGSRSYQMVELALAHLADPKQTPQRQWEALQTLKRVAPELRQSIIDSETPISRSGSTGDTPAPSPSHGASPAKAPAVRTRYDMNGNEIK